MAKFDPARVAPSAESLEHCTDSVGTVIGYYVRLSDGTEAMLSTDFVRDHFGAKKANSAPADKLAAPEKK